MTSSGRLAAPSDIPLVLGCGSLVRILNGHTVIGFAAEANVWKRGSDHSIRTPWPMSGQGRPPAFKPKKRRSADFSLQSMARRQPRAGGDLASNRLVSRQRGKDEAVVSCSMVTVR